VADGDMVAAAAAAAAAEAAARNASLKVAVEERQYAAKMKLAIEACGDDVRKAEELARQMVEHVYAMRGAAAAQQPQQQPQPGLSAAAFAAEPPFVPPAALVVAAAEHAAGAAAGYTAVTPCGTAAGAATAGGCSGQEPQQVGQAVEDSTAAPAAPAPAAAEPLTGQPRTRQAAKRAAAAAAAASRGDPKRARKQSCKLRDMEVDGAAGSASGGTDEQQQQQQEEEEAEEACDGGGPGERGAAPVLMTGWSQRPVLNAQAPVPCRGRDASLLHMHAGLAPPILGAPCLTLRSPHGRQRIRRWG
jgi:hypothetical protein